MSDERQFDAAADGSEDLLPGSEYEEITSDEVDRVVEELEHLMESVESENIRFHLEGAADGIYRLIYDDEEADEPDSFTDAA